MTLLPGSVTSAWDGASPRERLLLRWGALIVMLAVLYAIAWQPLARDTARTRESLALDRATLAVLQHYAAPQRSSGTVEPASTDARAAVERALDARGLRAAASQIDVRDNRVSVLLGAVPFDALVALLDDLAKTDRLRVIEARVTARVEPGTVRAELALGR